MMRGMIPFPRRFLIPTDGGPEARAAARLGLRLARALGASARALSVVDPQMAYRIHRFSSPEPRPRWRRMPTRPRPPWRVRPGGLACHVRPRCAKGPYRPRSLPRRVLIAQAS